MQKLMPIILLLLLTSCINRIVTSYQKPESLITSDSCNPLIVIRKDIYGLKANYLGSIMIDEPYTSLTISSCSKDAALKRLKSDGCNLSANLINIITEINPGEEIPPYHRSPCYRCIADYYKIDFDSLNSKILAENNRELFYYSSDMRLKWEDFKVVLPESYEKPYEFISTIHIKSGKISIWTGVFKEFEGSGVFYSDISKVKKSYANEKNEKVIGLLFDLTQVYAKKLEMFLNSKKPKIADRNKIQNIVNDYLNKLNSEIDQFNLETNFGTNHTALDYWTNKIESECIDLKIKD